MGLLWWWPKVTNRSIGRPQTIVYPLSAQALGKLDAELTIDDQLSPPKNSIA